MIYNEKIASSYGSFIGTGTTNFPLNYKPTVREENYKTGYLARYFAKKVNENKIIEIENRPNYLNNNQLYKIVSLKWKISGPKNNVYKGNILDKSGVMEQNKFEIDRVKIEEGVDLSSTLTNLLEFWQGR
jgi:hypothetical protein